MKDRLLSKEKFCETMDQIKESFDYADNLNDFFRSNRVDGYLYQPNCMDTALNLLRFMYHDDNDWIGYYVFELEWGRDYSPGCTTESDGTEIQLDTTEHLYDLLLKNMKELEDHD